MSSARLAVLTSLTLIAAAVVLRLLPHPANFAPVTAIAIFGGAVLPRKVAILIPLGAMIVSDLIIGFYDIMPVVWGCYLLIALVSSLWLRQLSVRKTVLLTFGASILFFVVTNFAVWVAGDMYAHTWTGLAQCYAMALPFFRNTLLSDLLYTGLLFGCLITARIGERRIFRPELQRV